MTGLLLILRIGEFMNTKEKTKLLTMGILCCGRAETTERCLKSLMPIREAIDSEIQVVDTGCSPETRAVIEKYADEVFEFTWCNDFAKARNFQLDQANGKMFLFLDDDEWFLEPEKVIDFFKRPDCLMYNIGGYYQRNYLDYDGKEYQDTIVNRMMTVTPETKFIGKVHEYIEPSSGNAFFMDVQVGHYGYVYTNEEDNVKHAMRNIPLLKEMMKEQPDNLRWSYQLAQEYKSIFEYEELYELCKECYEKTKDSNDGEDIKYRGNFICGLIYGLYCMKDKEDECIELANKFIEEKKELEYPLAYIVYYKANACFTKRDNEGCKRACELYLKYYDEVGADKEKAFLQGGLFVDGTFEAKKLNMIYCFLMTIGLDNDDYGPLVHYYRKIDWKAPVVRLNRGFMMSLLHQAAKIGYKKEIRDVLNKFFSNKGFRDLIEYQIEQVYMEISDEELMNIRDAFKTTEGQKEIEAFIDVRRLEKEFYGIDKWDSFNELTARLSVYVDMVQQWKRLHDSWLKDDDTTENLPKEVILATGINQFFDTVEKGDVTMSLKVLKNLFGVREAMNPAVGELSRLYGDVSKILLIRENQPGKFAEMYDLEEAVLRQIADLDAAGHEAEAIETYKQLVEVLNNTFGVDTLHI